MSCLLLDFHMNPQHSNMSCFVFSPANSAFSANSALNFKMYNYGYKKSLGSVILPLIAEAATVSGEAR